MTSDKTQENGLKLHQERFSLDVRNNFFTEGVAEHCSRLPRKVVVESLETSGMFNRRVDVTQRDMY